MNLIRYEISFHERTVSRFVNGQLERQTSFAAAQAYQRDVIRLLLASLHRNRFEMVAPSERGMWAYEGRMVA